MRLPAFGLGRIFTSSKRPMPTSFLEPPLIEVIVELRWSPGTAVPQANGTQFSALDGAQLEDYFHRFGGEVYSRGFQRAERLIPPGFPAQPHLAVMRYRNDAARLFQVGAGLFTANAVPPYQTWEAFSPLIGEGIDCMMRTRPEAEKSRDFSSVALRYLNAFNGAHWQGKKPVEFIRDVLGFDIILPNAVKSHAPTGKMENASVQIQLPINGFSLLLNVVEGIVNNAPSVIVDLGTNSSTAISADASSVMDTLNRAHDVLHSLFFDLVAPFSKLLKPVET